MTAYQQGDFVRTVEQLETLSELEPANSAEVDFYLGVSLLLTGRGPEAVAPLKRAAQSNDDQQREAPRFYLALAHLKQNEIGQATAELDAVIEMNGEHALSAKDLKRRILDGIK